jgi:uncharacterized protein
MEKQEIINKTAKFIKNKFTDDSSGHDWWHIYRCWQTASNIAKKEKADRFIVAMAVLLHDLGDYKLEPDKKGRQKEKIGAWLKKMKVSSADSTHILHIITHMSFSKNIFRKQSLSIEGKIVQDADRLDAIGAMGIMRVFLFVGSHNIPGYDPERKITSYKNVRQYQKHAASAINHFYEKLLL